MKNITENNNLIAEFMGAEILQNGIIRYSRDSGNTLGFSEDLLYHLSWDHLMPVVGKIMSIYTDTMYCDKVSGVLYTDLHNAISKVDKKIIYKAVVGFVKWYNSNK